MKEQNDQVKIKLLKTDRYGRTLGELYSENGEFL
jgi:endonuclease YncB( thermonuclease family)